MARNESDREDLLREAVGLVPRVELRFPIGVQLTTSWQDNLQNGSRNSIVRTTDAALTQRPADSATEASPTVVAGFNKQGGVSLYFNGGDPVLQFDSTGKLRRAFVNGLLYRSAGKSLSRLTRERTETETTLQRRELNAAECTAFLAAADQLVRMLHAAIVIRAWTESVEEPAGSAAVEQLRSFLERLLSSPLSLSSALKV